MVDRMSLTTARAATYVQLKPNSTSNFLQASLPLEEFESLAAARRLATAVLEPEVLRSYGTRTVTHGCQSRRLWAFQKSPARGGFLKFSL